ncbi:unnamed protein product [Pleuronectes platessa]|uniref:Uncharacterized protein n=1 Tax=Pleuronectes platessa TaxID=8262 RepID=A0A9N7YPZ0_PLEPL|nr:unnamed protein product [Pleuronectes platessa]
MGVIDLKPLGYVTGSAVPEQQGAETDVDFGVDSTGEGGASPESTTAVPETATNTGSTVAAETPTVGVTEVSPEEEDAQSPPEEDVRVRLRRTPRVREDAQSPPEEDVQSPPEVGVKGVPAGGTGATECGPSGVPNGQWMKIPRPGYNEGAGASGSNTKGYGAGAGVPSTHGAKPNGYGAGAGAGPYSNGGGTKANKPAYGAGRFPGLGNGYGAGFRFPYAGNRKQPGYGQGAHPGAGYGNGNSYGGYGNGYTAGVQPDFASLGQGLPTDAKSGGAAQVPYNGAPVVPAGLDGSQFEPQAAGLGPNGKLGGMYGGMGGLPFAGHGMGAETYNAKYGIGGLQFGGQPLGTGTNGAGKHGYAGGPYGPTGDGKSAGTYGGLGAGTGGEPAPGQYGYTGLPNAGQHLGHVSNGNIAGKYGYGRMPYEAQPAALSPQVKSAGQYGQPASAYQPEHLGLGHNGKLSSQYGGGEVPYTPEALGYGGEEESAGKYGNQGAYPSQPLESVSEGRSVGDYETDGLPYESLPSEADSPGKSYVKGELQAPVAAAESEGMSVDGYDNMGYINGHVQPEAVSFPAPTPDPSLADPSVPSYLPLEASFTPDVLHGEGVEDLSRPPRKHTVRSRCLKSPTTCHGRSTFNSISSCIFTHKVNSADRDNDICVSHFISFSSNISRKICPRIGPTEGMPLGQLNKSLAWNYTCPMMGLEEQTSPGAVVMPVRQRSPEQSAASSRM